MKVENFIKSINKAKEKDTLDLSYLEDLSIAIMNLVSLEEHCFFSYAKTNNKKFLEMLEKTRELRKKLLKLLVKDDDGSEKWCMSKHYLASSMRLFETANRFLHEGKQKEAESLYKDSAELYGMFWLLNSNKDKLELKDENKKSIFGSIKELLKCCIE